MLGDKDNNNQHIVCKSTKQKALHCYGILIFQGYIKYNRKLKLSHYLIT